MSVTDDQNGVLFLCLIASISYTAQKYPALDSVRFAIPNPATPGLGRIWKKIKSIAENWFHIL